MKLIPCEKEAKTENLCKWSILKCISIRIREACVMPVKDLVPLIFAFRGMNDKNKVTGMLGISLEI